MLAVIKGAGDLASGVAHRFFRAGLKVVMTEVPVPTTVRRTVAFSPAIYLGHAQVEGVTAIRAESARRAEEVIAQGAIPVLADPGGVVIRQLCPDVVVDAILAKRNTGTTMSDAPAVIALGPGFYAGKDCHAVVETKRGHYLGRVIYEGEAIPDTGIPGEVGGYTVQRLVRGTGSGPFEPLAAIGDRVHSGQLIARCGETPVFAAIDGVLRGLLQGGVPVFEGMKCGDIDPRCERDHCFTISDKARAVAGGALEAALCLRHKRGRGAF